MASDVHGDSGPDVAMADEVRIDPYTEMRLGVTTKTACHTSVLLQWLAVLCDPQGWCHSLPEKQWPMIREVTLDPFGESVV